MRKRTDRIEKLERDCFTMREALKALILNDRRCMHEVGAKCVTGEFGDGEQDDVELGIWFYKKGAMLGDIDCQWDYAMMLYSGEHMQRDIRKALSWFKKAMENPSAASEYELDRRKDAREMYEIVKQELAEEKKGQRKKKQPRNPKQKKIMNLNRTDYAGYQLSST